MSRIWNRVEEVLPEENVVVLTISPGGAESLLYRYKALWFVPDGSMYMYYTPLFWLPC